MCINESHELIKVTIYRREGFKMDLCSEVLDTSHKVWKGMDRRDQGALHLPNKTNYNFLLWWGDSEFLLLKWVYYKESELRAM